MGQPTLPDINSLIAAGIDPKTGLPAKLASVCGNIKPDIKRMLRIADEQDAVNRYVWDFHDTPIKLTSQELERMIYYKGQLILFYFEDLEEFYFMPYALQGSIDFYNRFNTVHPVPMTAGKDDEKSQRYKTQYAMLSNLKLSCQYVIPKDKDKEDTKKMCVIVRDYTNQLPQDIIPRATINETVIDVMSECVPYMRTALINSTGVRGVRVQDADQAASVVVGSRGVQKAAESGLPYVPMTGTLEFQDLANGQVGKAEEFMSAMKSLDNLRLSSLGIDNGGLFEKKAHELQTEANINEGTISSRLQDGLKIRQNLCDIANAIWGDLGCNISVSIAEELEKPEEPQEEPMMEGDNENDTTVQH